MGQPHERQYERLPVEQLLPVRVHPTNLIPGQTSTACNSGDASNIPYSWIDLYVCEGPAGGDVGSISGYCAVNSGHWRKAGGSSATGYYNSFYHRCDVTSLVIYNAPAGKAAVSFNMVVKPGSATRSRPLRLTSIASTDPERFLTTGTGAPDATGGGVDAARSAARRLALAALAFVVALAWAQDARAFCQAASCVPDGVGTFARPASPTRLRTAFSRSRGRAAASAIRSSATARCRFRPTWPASSSRALSTPG